MKTIKRLQRLKLQASALINEIERHNPLSSLSIDHVSESGLTGDDLSERIQRVQSCSSLVELKESWEKKDELLEQILSVSAANYCKQHVLCPICADRSQARRRAKYDDSIRTHARLGLHPYLVTYTITDGDNLAERLQHLKRSLRSFRRMGQKRRHGQSGGEAGKIVAGLLTIEIKRGEHSGKWHVHAHEVVFTNDEIDYVVYNPKEKSRLRSRFGSSIPKSELSKIAERRIFFRGEIVPASKVSEEWSIATGGDSMGIHFEKLRHVPRQRMVLKNGQFRRERVAEKTRLKYLRMSYEEAIAYQSKEALKYITKPGDNSPVDAITILQDTYNRQLVSSYGGFRGVGGDLYDDPAGQQDATWVLRWDTAGANYGDPVPGTIRESLDLEEKEHETRSICGRLTGQYRRQRRFLISKRDLYGGSLYRALDDAKAAYRAQIRSTWALYHQAQSASKRAENSMCDNYSVVLSTDGAYIPGSDHRTLFQAAFS